MTAHFHRWFLGNTLYSIYQNRNNAIPFMMATTHILYHGKQYLYLHFLDNKPLRNFINFDALQLWKKLDPLWVNEYRLVLPDWQFFLRKSKTILQIGNVLGNRRASTHFLYLLFPWMGYWKVIWSWTCTYNNIKMTLMWRKVEWTQQTKISFSSFLFSFLFCGRCSCNFFFHYL